jgi:hypothetical protein
MEDSPPWASLALLPPIGGTPTGFQRGSALGTAKREAGSGGASPYPELRPSNLRRGVPIVLDLSIVFGEERRTNGKKEHEES